MIAIENGAVRLAAAQDASTIVIEDKRRRLSWRLDTSFRRCCREGCDSPGLLPPGRAERRGDAIVVRHAFAGAWGIYNYFPFVDIYHEEEDVDAIMFAKSEIIIDRYCDSWEDKK